MLDNIVIGRYYPINSYIHRMNPLSKTICTFIFIILAFLSTNIIYNLLILSLVVIITLMTSVPLKLYLKTIWSLKFIIIFIIIINLIFKVNLIIISVMIIRLIILVIYSSILTLTTTPSDLTYGLERFFNPLKLIGIPVSKMALSLTLAIRFIPNLLDESKKILKAQSSRGINQINFKNKLISLKSLIIPLFTLSIKKADLLAQSMELRLYSLNDTRSNYRVKKWHFFDFYMVVIHAIILIVTIVKEVF